MKHNKLKKQVKKEFDPVDIEAGFNSLEDFYTKLNIVIIQVLENYKREVKVEKPEHWDNWSIERQLGSKFALQEVEKRDKEYFKDD